MRLSIVTLLTLIQLSFAAVHFYLEPKATKCFYKELPKGSLLVIHYKPEGSTDNGQSYREDPNLSVLFQIEEVFDANHKVANQRGQDGRFLFTALDSGRHRICATPTSANGYALDTKSRITLDMEVGDPSLIVAEDASKVGNKLQMSNLYRRLDQIKLEYLSFRGREAEFRDMSEQVNSDSVKWTIIQLIVLGVCCYVQMQSLKKFFIKQKVV